MTGFTFADFSPALPEIILAAGALVLVLFGAIRGDRSEGVVNGLSVALLLAAAAAVFLQPAEVPVTAFGGSFTWDAFAQFLKLVTLVGAIIALLMSFNYFKHEKLHRFEFGMIDRDQLTCPAVRRHRRKMDERRDAPIGEPGNSIDQLLVLIDRVFTWRLDFLDASQRERC